MKKLKIKLLKAMVYLCDIALNMQEGIELEEINWMVSARNDCLRKLNKLER